MCLLWSRMQLGDQDTAEGLPTMFRVAFSIVYLAACVINTHDRLTRFILDNVFLGFFNVPTCIVFCI